MALDARVDGYIAARAEFARPILARLRAATHRALPGVEEAIRWSAPFFLVAGRPVAMMAGFKAHVRYALWHGPAEAPRAPAAWLAIRSPDDLPDEETLATEIAHAVEQVRTAPLVARPRPERAAVELPGDFAAALAAEPRAAAAFARFPAGARADYILWIVEAKRAETRAGRLSQAVAWIAEGKRRNWKYERG